MNPETINQNMKVKTPDGEGFVFGFNPENNKYVVVMSRLNQPAQFKGKHPILGYEPDKLQEVK